jgi:Protein of unknown function (DUF982)
MDDKRFPSPLELRLTEARTRRVATVWEAIECLQSQWPITTRPAYRVAMRICRDALDGLRPVSEARRAFRAAAREAGLLGAKGRAPLVSQDINPRRTGAPATESRSA